MDPATPSLLSAALTGAPMRTRLLWLLWLWLCWGCVVVVLLLWRWWWWLCGLCIRRVCLSIHANGCNELNRAGASAPAPSAGLTSRKKPYACSLRRQVPGVPSANLTQPQLQGEEKDCEAHPPHPPLLRRKQRSNLFHRLGVGCPGSGMNIEDAPGRVFLVSRTLLPTLLPESRR